MFQFNFDTFLGSFRSAFPPPYDKMTAGLQFVLGKIGEDNDNWANLSQIAYGLATFKWERVTLFSPWWSSPGNRVTRTLRNTTQERRSATAGKYRTGGWRALQGARLRTAHGPWGLRQRGQQTIDLIGNPGSALDPEVAYKIAARGLKEGWFSGRGLSRYIVSDEKADFKAARQIINGHDHDTDIAANCGEDAGGVEGGASAKCVTTGQGRFPSGPQVANCPTRSGAATKG